MHKLSHFLLAGFFLASYQSLLPIDQAFRQNIPTSINKPLNNQDVWINIFVHGTIGSSLMFLNYKKIRRDDVENTRYKRTLKNMRAHPTLRLDQTILEKGLVKIAPSDTCYFKDGMFCGVILIAKAMHEISCNVSPSDSEKSIQHYYTYGWSGCLSQKRRRFEALRFYNELSEEVQKYKDLGITPKIRIWAHSHGGNICLNLAGIRDLVYGFKRFYSKFTYGAYVQRLFKSMIDNLPSKEIAKINLINNKPFDYVPEAKGLVVDELVNFGTPVQAETELFYSSSFFKSVVNLYSDGDLVQGSDKLSSSVKKCDQIVQERAAFGKDFSEVRVLIDSEISGNQRVERKSPPKRWKEVAHQLRFHESRLPDPTHRELWFVVAKNHMKNKFFRPLPISAFSPILMHLKSFFKADKVTKFDFWIIEKKDGLLFKLVPVQTQEVSSIKNLSPKEFFMTRDFFDKMSQYFDPVFNAKIVSTNSKIMDRLVNYYRKLNM